MASTSSTRAKILEGFGVEFCQVDSGFDEEGLFEALLESVTKKVRGFRECEGRDLRLQGGFYLQGDFCKNLSSKTLAHIKNLIGENVEGYLALNPKQIAWECAKGKLESVLKKITQNYFTSSEDFRERNMQEVLKEGILACDSVVVVHLPHIAKNLSESSAMKSASTSKSLIAPNSAFISKSTSTPKPTLTTKSLIASKTAIAAKSTQNLDSSLDFEVGFSQNQIHAKSEDAKNNDTRNHIKNQNTKNHTRTNLLLRKAKTPTQARIMLELQSGNPISIITAFAYQSHKGFFCNVDCAEFLLDEFCQDDIEQYVKSSLWQGSAGSVKVEGFHKGYILSQNGLESCALGLSFERILPFLGII
ncbi:Maf family protein [Helicobacter sp. MIT 01-3238]|uniref:Maf family protein n=1 Tax=Helicobacter sp. MIT 01-3238 TaxID=398627 RepID=UPI0015F196F7|nr:Maf family protein [Helicobacter sp. MIT 01-3238]